MAEASSSLAYTPTWVVASVCLVFVLLSLWVERALHHLGKFLKRKKQDALFEALQKLKEELMILGFISLLLSVFQTIISRVCIPDHLAEQMTPCKNHAVSEAGAASRRLLSSETAAASHCPKGKVPIMSVEALHQLHIFIFVLAVVQVIFCGITIFLGSARIRQWKAWEKSILKGTTSSNTAETSSGAPLKTEIDVEETRKHHLIFRRRATGYWRRAVVVSWTISFFKQFHNSITKSDYIALRHGFIMKHCPSVPEFDFHQFMMRTLEVDFKKIVGISWFLWLFVVFFLLLNVHGWNTYFWLSILPLALLLLVGTKLEHIITRLALDIDPEAAQVRPSDDHFWFGRPAIILWLIHFILFQNAFEIAFYFWILCTYGFHSCMREKLGLLIPRLVMGVVVQVVCSYSTLPLYALVSQMGSTFKRSMFQEHTQQYLKGWVGEAKFRKGHEKNGSSGAQSATTHKLAKQSTETLQIELQEEDGNEQLQIVK
ncbi:hypothetical protein MLD38_013643 [Melastoma candidum]|uniref:Uncharacterized protein n=1 Tax=Melastoma candidum TaxID=119954 RepID=A0ACB9RAB2_9MYRT|nr:hypothetical protein MLD38_013643 [Melastoma candidum]